MMEQYRRIKREHQGEVLFFRLGDFYEMFFEDALEVSSLLNLTLTHRGGHPMCGIPYHASRSYIARLLKSGKKIAICEQTGEGSRGLMDRQVVEVITPGTTIEDDFLDQGSSNYLACLAFGHGAFSFSYIDLSAGEFYATSFPPAGAAQRFRQELERTGAKELIIQEALLNEYPPLALALEERSTLVVNRWADWLFDPQKSRDRLERQFGASLKSFGLGEKSPELISAGALLDYLDDTAKSLIPHVRAIRIYGEEEYVLIDESTQRNLELVRNLMDGETRFSLLSVMDETRTAMGRRLLKSRILRPLRDLAAIEQRLDMVEALYRNQDKLSRLRELLAKTPDLERLCSRLAMDKAHGKDLLGLSNALGSFALVQALADDLPHPFVYESPEAASLKAGHLKALAELKAHLDRAIAEDPSILLSEGNLIKEGYSPELDQLRELQNSGRKLLETYLEEEKEATGITGLKVRYNRQIGYFFEVSNQQIAKVPPRFFRRQGLAGAERFSTDRLSKLESDINGAAGQAVELERILFLEVRRRAKNLLEDLGSAGRRLAETDAAQAMARAATIQGWVRPQLDRQNRTIIREGRHPVVEANLRRGEFIPNDLDLDTNNIAFALITGPNMAGKSTYLRQAALITIMAQAGSFVPAAEAQIGLVDRIYCRVGASDNLARGESTFLVEMNETAHILLSATEQSLVIMDEVGRGTGTEDGLAIAWAVCEEILETIRCRCLFATHYRELSRIDHPRMANRSMDVAEREGEIIFLRKLREGPAAGSYGLHVAALAGLPEQVIKRAAELMAVPSTPGPRTPTPQGTEPRPQLLEFNPPQKTSPQAENIAQELAALDINVLSPLDAFALIQRWKINNLQ
ncbi:MAG: DNA mismatch repair protein MutS [Treponema sp.]|nr:DNA mismatch repair protein MutS [Treponema sp.]